MTANNVIQGLLYLGSLVLVAKPLGLYMAGVFNGKTPLL